MAKMRLSSASMRVIRTWSSWPSTARRESPPDNTAYNPSSSRRGPRSVAPTTVPGTGRLVRMASSRRRQAAVAATGSSRMRQPVSAEASTTFRSRQPAIPRTSISPSSTRA